MNIDMPVPKIHKFGIKNYLYSFPFFLMLIMATSSIISPETNAGSDQVNYLKYFNIFIYTVALILLLINFNRIIPVLNGRWLYIFFMLYISVSALWSADPTSTLRISAYFWVVAIVSLIAVVAFKNHPEKFFQTLVLYSVVMIGGSLIMVFLNPGRGIGEDGRWLGLTSHANGLGLMSIVSIWANISYIFMTKSNFVKILNIFMILSAALCIYGANSVTSLVVSVAIVALTFLLRTFDTTRITRLVAQIVGAGFFVILCFSTLYVLAPEIFSIDAMFGAVGRNSTFTGRTALWETAMTKISEDPLIGSGFQEYINISGTKIKHFHSGYIELLIRGGILAVLFLAAFVFQLFFSLKRFSNPNVYVYSLVMILAILAHNVTEGSFGRGFNALWLVFTFIYFYTDRNKRMHTQFRSRNSVVLRSA